MTQPPPSDQPGEQNPLEHDDQIIDQESGNAKAAQKVALDLDDAPFLDETPPEEPKAPAPREVSPPAQSVDSGSDDHKDDKPTRKLLIMVGAVAMLLLAGVLTFWLVKPGPAPPPEPQPEIQPEPVEEVEAPPKEPKPDEHFVDFAPFWVTYNQNGEVRFLSLRMSLVTDDPMLSLEVQRKTIILRDAAYYFLNNRPMPTVKRAEAAETLKQDILSVFNQHLSRPLAGVLIEEYLVQ